MADTKKMLQEYSETEAGKVLVAHGFEPKRVGGVVVFRGERGGVVLDVVASTGMAPREDVDPVTVSFSAKGSTNESWTLSFPHLAVFLATLQ